MTIYDTYTVETWDIKKHATKGPHGSTANFTTSDYLLKNNCFDNN